LDPDEASQEALEGARSRRGPLLALGAAGLLVVGCCALALSSRLVRDIARGVLERSAPADVATPRELVGARYRLSYPGNWRLDTADDDYDPDRTFDLNAPAQGTVVFQLLPRGSDPEEAVEGICDEVEGVVVHHARRHRFERWGDLEGYGIELDGSLVVAPGRVRVFGHAGEGVGVVVMEIRYDEDEANNAPGYELIASSFELRPSE